MANKFSPQGINSPAVESDSPMTRQVSGGSPLRWLLPMLLVLGVVMAAVWGTRSKEVEIYNPPPSPVKTIAQIQQQIDSIKGNNRIPKNDKGRILGFMSMEMEQAKARERGDAPPPLSPNPPSAPK